MSSPLFRGPVVIGPESEFGFKYLTDVPKFEDEVIVPVVEPGIDLHEWQTRTPIRDLVTPSPKIFHGRLEDITLTVLDAPIERLLDAKKERGRKFRPAGPDFYTRMAKLIQEDSVLIGRCMGFTFRAMASSSRQANITSVEADIWYLPDPRQTTRGRDEREGRQLLRVVTKPEYDENALVTVHKAASRMGAVAAQQGPRSPLQAVRLDSKED